MAHRLAPVLLAVATVLPVGAIAEGTPKFAVDPSHSSLSYKVVHPFHESIGKTSTLEGAAVIKPEGGALVQIRVDVRTFDSGNSNRDDHMKECTEANKLPYATLKGLLNDFRLPTAFPADLLVTLDGEMEFHGRKRPVTVPLTVHFDSAAHAHVVGGFDFSLDAYQVERPSLMMRKIDDVCHISVDVDFAQR